MDARTVVRSRVLGGFGFCSRQPADPLPNRLAHIPPFASGVGVEFLQLCCGKPHLEPFRSLHLWVYCGYKPTLPGAMASRIELQIAALQARIRELDETRKTEVLDPTGISQNLEDFAYEEIARRMWHSMPPQTRENPEALRLEVRRRFELSRALWAEYDQAKAELDRLQINQRNPNCLAALMDKRLEDYKQHIKQFPKGAPSQQPPVPAPAKTRKANVSLIQHCKTIGKIALTTLAIAGVFAFPVLVFVCPKLLLSIIALVAANQIWQAVSKRSN